MTPKTSHLALLFFSFFVITFSSNSLIFAEDDLEVLSDDGSDTLFHTYLIEEVEKQSSQRKEDVAAALQSKELLEARQEMLRSNYRMLLGDLPEKTDLNDTILGTISKSGYKIERLYFESLPNHHVTANFYYPNNSSGPYPTVLVTCGHYDEAKAADLYQRLCILFATNDIAALIVDPICQGERNQIIDTKDTTDLYYYNESGTKAHTRLDVGSNLVGTSVVAYELWDNHRAIDYLYTRTDIVDTSKIGLTASSGGGAQATYLAAFDNRIKVAAVNSFIMNEPTLYKTIGPQTGSQNLSYEGEYSIDHPDYITMFAPKPFMILSATQDFFDIEGTYETLEEVEKVYDTLGVPNKIGFFEYNDEHGYSQPKREVAVKWFRTWFYNDTTSISEPSDLDVCEDYDLSVTTEGQVFLEFDDEAVVEKINYSYATKMASDRADFWQNQTTDSCLQKVKELIKLDEDYATPTATITGTVERDGYSIEKIKLTSDNLTPITGLLFIPDGVTSNASAVLYVDGRGKDYEAEEGDIIEKIYVDSGKIVFSIDVRGFGETKDDESLNESKHGNIEHRNAVISNYIGKTLIGQRVEDIMKAVDYLNTRSEINSDSISIVGIDRAGTAVLHAAALDERINDVVIRQWTDTSWVTIVEQPTVKNNMTHVVQSALKYYDLPDLINAISPRSVKYSEDPTLPETSAIYESINNNDFIIQCYPNPANSFTEFSYKIDQPGNVSLKIYDSNGSKVLELVDEFQSAGSYHTQLQSSQLESGIYFYNLTVNGTKSNTNKLIIL